MKYLDRSSVEHGALALIITLIGFELGNIYAGAAGAIFLFIGREVTQAEYRWIEKYGKGLRSNMPWYAPFTPCAWDIHSVLDLVVPVLIIIPCVLVKYLTMKGII